MPDVIMYGIMTFGVGLYLTYDWRVRGGWKGMCWMARGAWVATLVGSAGTMTGPSPFVLPSYFLSIGGIMVLALHEPDDDDDDDDDGEKEETRIKITVPKFKAWGVPARRPQPA